MITKNLSMKIIIIIIFWSFDFSFVLLREGFPFMYWRL